DISPPSVADEDVAGRRRADLTPPQMGYKSLSPSNGSLHRPALRQFHDKNSPGQAPDPDQRPSSGSSSGRKRRSCSRANCWRKSRGETPKWERKLREKTSGQEKPQEAAMPWIGM